MEVFFAIIAVVLIYGYSTTSTKVVLLDNNSTQNEITISNEKGKTVLNKPNTYVAINKNNSSISHVKNISQKELDTKYKDVVTQNILQPVSFLFYFESGSTKLTDESLNNLKNAYKAIQDRYPCDVSVIGHSDTQGSDELNIKLSLKRAKLIEQYIQKQNLKIQTMKVESFGEKDLLIQTKDGVNEPKNRRVEVLVR